MCSRGCRTAWERARCYPNTTRLRIRDYGADVRSLPGEYIVSLWEGWHVPVDVWAIDDAGALRHVATVDSASVRAAIEQDSGIAGKMNYPIVAGRFTADLPIGAAFVIASQGPAMVFRIVSRGKKRVMFSTINFDELRPGETLYAPSHRDFRAVLRERPVGNVENDYPRWRLTDEERAMIPAGVEFLEYPTISCARTQFVGCWPPRQNSRQGRFPARGGTTS